MQQVLFCRAESFPLSRSVPQSRCWLPIKKIKITFCPKLWKRFVFHPEICCFIFTVHHMSPQSEESCSEKINLQSLKPPSDPPESRWCAWWAPIGPQWVWHCTARQTRSNSACSQFKTSNISLVGEYPAWFNEAGWQHMSGLINALSSAHRFGTICDL